MRYRQLGRSGLRVSELTLGTMGFGGSGRFADVGDIDVADAQRQLDLALDAGINLVDTADAYSDGASEEVLGEALKGRRDRVLVATKARFPTGPGPNDQGLSRHHLIAACEDSLRRMGLDHIDLLQVHEWDGSVPLEETLEALDSLVRSGKVRYVGSSNFSGWHLAKAKGVAERHGYRGLRRLPDLLLAGVPRRRVRADPGGDRQRRRRPRLEPARRRPPDRQVPPRHARARGCPRRQHHRRPLPDPRPRPSLRHRRCPGRDRRRPRPPARAGRPRLAPGPPRRHLPDRRRPRRGPAVRQPRRDRAGAERRGDRAPGAHLPPAPPLPLLAPVRLARRPHLPRRPRAARQLRRLRRPRPGCARPPARLHSEA